MADQAAQKQVIESSISEQNRLLASVKDEIAEMRAEEARRQAELAAQARARLAAQQLAAQQAQDVADQGYAPTDLADTAIPVAPPPDGSKASQVIAQSCAARIRDALDAIADVEAIDIDEDADLARVRLGQGSNPSEQTVADVLEAVSRGSGHAYRVRSGSWAADEVPLG